MQACLQLWGQWDFGYVLLLLLLASGCELWSMGQCMHPGDVGTASCCLHTGSHVARCAGECLEGKLRTTKK